MTPALDASALTMRVNRLQRPVYNLGPGRRIALWVQGCSLGCAGCISPSLWDAEGGSALQVRALAETLARAGEGYDGLTVSGGEPFEQYPALMLLVALLKKLRAMTVVVYSGYTLEELRQRHPDEAFLRYLDFLVDGRFERERPAHENFRGSVNQRLFRLNDGRVEQVSEGFDGRIWSLSVPDASRAFLTGVPKPGELLLLGRPLRVGGKKARFR